MCVYCYVLYIHFVSTSTSILNLTTSKEREFDIKFNGIPCVQKYCQFFTRESIIDQYVSVSICRHCKVLDENAEQCWKPCQKQPFPLESRGLPSNTLSPLTTPNDSSIALHNDATKSPLVTMRRCKFTPQHHQNLIHSYRA